MDPSNLRGREFDFIVFEEYAYSVGDFPSYQQPEAVLKGRLCPYCGKPTEYIDSDRVYSKSYGMLYACLPCKAWVGVHHKTGTAALGRIANKELRNWKMAAHRSFDSLWKMSGKKNRRPNAYKWLAEQLGIDRHFAHIGMFNVEQCKATIEVCQKLRDSLSGRELQKR